MKRPVNAGLQKRIAILGVGHVGATSAYTLIQSGLAREIVMIDLDSRRAEGEAMDLLHAAALTQPVRIWAGDYRDTAEAAMVVIAAGVGGRPGESRLDLLDRNVGVIREVVRQVMAAGFQGVILMTTNPVDILAQVAQAESGLPSAQVLSSGTVLDTARLRAILSEELQVDARSIHAHIIGEHGDSEVAAWSCARVAGQPLLEFAGAARALDLPDILNQVRRAAGEIIQRKGYTAFAIAACVTRICEAILDDEKTVLPVSTLTTGQHGVSEIYLSLPCVVGRHGVERIIELPLDQAERDALQTSAEILRRTYDRISGSAAPGKGTKQ